MSPPSVKQKAEEEGEKESGVEIRSVNIEDTISLERSCWSLSESSCDGQITNSADES